MIPLRTKLEVALKAAGYAIDEIEWDHTPPLALRDWDEKTGDTVPPANSPLHIQIIRKVDHRRKTFGQGGEKRVTTAGSDIHAISKAKRVAKQQEAFRARLLSPETAKAIDSSQTRNKRRMPSRPFPKNRKVF